MEEPKKISIHHLYYTIIIAVIILVCAVLVVPCSVTEQAFDNFSFASTITSIVLAVVSIVYSIQSGNASNIQLNNVRDIDAEIKRQLESFGHIEENVSKLLDGGMSKIQDDVKRITEGQVELSTRLNGLGKDIIDNPPKNTIFTGGSAYGHILLYACSLSYKTAKSLPIRIFDEEQSDYNYWLGYFVAILAALKDRIQIEQGEKESSPLASQITKFDEDFFGSSFQIRDMLNRNLDNNSLLKGYLNKIDNCFCQTSESETTS